MHGASAPETPAWRKDGQALIVGMPNEGDETSGGRAAVDEVREVSHAVGADVRVGGSGPLNADFIDAVYGAFPLMIALISLLTFLLLARAFRSLLLPLKAVAMNFVSIAGSFGALVWIFQDGHLFVREPRPLQPS